MRLFRNFVFRARSPVQGLKSNVCAGRGKIFNPRKSVIGLYEHSDGGSQRAVGQRVVRTAPAVKRRVVSRGNPSGG